MVQYFSFGHGTSPVPFSVRCEYTMTANTVQADGAPSSVNQSSAVSNLLTTILASQLTIRNKTNSKIEFICYKKLGENYILGKLFGLAFLLNCFQRVF